MGIVARPIVFDADSIIHLLECRLYKKVCEKLGVSACITKYVATEEVIYFKDRNTGRNTRYKSECLTKDSIPRLIDPTEFIDTEYEAYLSYFNSLSGADPGERDSIAVTWALGYDFCSCDGPALDIFRSNKPQQLPSRCIYLLDLLRKLKIIPQ